jgi:hypothetical protein
MLYTLLKMKCQDNDHCLPPRCITEIPKRNWQASITRKEGINLVPDWITNEYEHTRHTRTIQSERSPSLGTTLYSFRADLHENGQPVLAAVSLWPYKAWVMRSSSSAFGSACSGNALASVFFGVEWSIFAPRTAPSWRSAGSAWRRLHEVPMEHAPERPPLAAWRTRHAPPRSCSCHLTRDDGVSPIAAGLQCLGRDGGGMGDGSRSSSWVWSRVIYS